MKKLINSLENILKSIIKLFLRTRNNHYLRKLINSVYFFERSY